MSAVLFYTVGLPGAGKTTFAHSLSFWLGAHHLRGDKIGLELFRFPTYSPQQREAVYAEMSLRAGESLRAGRHILYDAAVNTRAQRDQLAALAQQSGGVAVGVWVQTSTELAKSRAGSVRDHGLAGPIVRVMPAHVFDQYVTAFEAPGDDEHIVLLAGDASFALQYRQLRRQLRGAGLPRLVQ